MMTYSELFAIGLVQFSRPCGVFTKQGFGGILLVFPQKKTAKRRVHYIFFSPEPREFLAKRAPTMVVDELRQTMVLS